MTATQDFRSLPPRPHIEHLRNEAKRRHATLKVLSRDARLSDAQLLLARDYGFDSWIALKAEVDRRRKLCGTVDSLVPMAMARPRMGRRDRVAALATPAMAEQALFPAAVMGLAVAEFGPLAPVRMEI